MNQSTLRACKRARNSSVRRGVSLVEMLVTLSIFGVVGATAIGFLLAQTKGFRATATRSDQIQNGRFGRDVMRQEMRTAGTNTTDYQPVVVYANDSVFAFNSDLLSNRTDSAKFTGAIYTDLFASASEASAFSVAAARAIPGTSFVYPLADYSSIAGTAGEAETIIFRFVRDTGSTNTSDYMLLRQVNAGVPEMLASGLRKVGSTPFFRYWYDPTRYSTTLTDLDTVPRAWLPLAKTVALRGVIPDTGTATTTRIDQVRTVEVSYEATRPRTSGKELVNFQIPLPNAAVDRQARACGRTPITPSAPSVTWNTDSAAVLLSWPRAADDNGGESDAVRYVIWRRVTGSATWGAPLASISVSGSSNSYRYKDGGVDTGVGRSYQYALAVQDCTPNLSGVASAGAVVVP
ncbi:MAG: prepilin-type N-terminal cleavage/methylation domain-containing protein [Phycisphaerae bacterium]|nr:prepilin-type N-terminal cleavage/methylation domain-containing protein [Gemmatimonadaceae bacterium]